MNNDDFQVLGSSTESVKSKKRKRILVALGFLALLAIIGLWCWGYATSKDKKVGEITIQPRSGHCDGGSDGKDPGYGRTGA